MKYYCPLFAHVENVLYVLRGTVFWDDMMDNAEIIGQEELGGILASVRTEQTVCTISHLAKGLWHVAKGRIGAENRLTLQLDLCEENKNLDLKIDQPVGIAFQHGFNKIMFETTVVGFDPAGETDTSRRIMVTRPVSAERMHRRAYERVTVPDTLNIDVLFWHRGYTDDHGGVPIDNYWQSKLLDLSAGGLLAEINSTHARDFRNGQLVGLQFTPLPYEKPLLLEGQIKHVASASESKTLQLGIEFVGLEANSDGREKLSRIAETLNTYTEHSNDAESEAENK